MVLSTPSYILAEVGLVCSVANTIHSGVSIRDGNHGLSRTVRLLAMSAFFPLGVKWVK